MARENIVIFGAGSCGKSIYHMLKTHFKVNISAIIDNENYGHFLDNVEVKRADVFLQENLEGNFFYLIAGKYSHEMYCQLTGAGVPSDNIYSLESFVVSHLKEGKYIQSDRADKNKREKVIIFDCSGGFVLGGVENWTYGLCGQLRKRGFDTRLYSNHMDVLPPVEFQNDIIHVKPGKDYYDSVEKTISQMLALLQDYKVIQCVLAHCNIFAGAAMILRALYPDRTGVISVVHSSLANVIQENQMIEPYVDYFLCVNHSVKEILGQRLVDSNKCGFMATPLETHGLNRSYALNPEEPIRIGYAARLEVEHKRADLLIPLMEELDRRKCNYRFCIAGEGRCYQDIDGYIKKKGRTGRVRMLGRVEYSKMHDFWNHQDIAVSLSETEGCSLSMLESMASGCVEVITNTLGTDWFVSDTENGYLAAIGDIEGIAERIEYLSMHRELLPVIGNRAFETIAEKCNMEKYVDFFESLLK